MQYPSVGEKLTAVEKLSTAVLNGSASPVAEVHRPAPLLVHHASGGKPGIRGKRLACGSGVTFFSTGCGEESSRFDGAGGAGVFVEGAGVGVPDAGGE
jgi:hypothetical protein